MKTTALRPNSVHSALHRCLDVLRKPFRRLSRRRWRSSLRNTRRAIRPGIVGMFAAALVSFAAMASDAPEAPSAVIAQWQATLLQTMKEAPILGIKGRYERLMAAMQRAFHPPTMVQMASGSYWSEATLVQREQLESAFLHLSASTIATIADGYSGESFQVKGERPGPKNTVLVETQIVKSDKSTVDITYIMAKFDSRWRAFDVVIDNGISEVSVHKSVFRKILETMGVDGLIQALNGKADQLIAAKADAPAAKN